MTIQELIDALTQWPLDYEVFVNYQRIEKVDVMEGTTSDGPGSLNIEGIEE